ncbi:hypothetical protein SCHPADRAFT_683320 [Schizopora paradoxa]|uniref:DUF6534 domain-containing protein n=1 Tax=Schizopora paradoxa TaxID=27342 RepID=A0A0H2R477_9AGAM|nr:hypothetical protein SCHPADRAFT_683320 [Schizopora paradoxa]
MYLYYMAFPKDRLSIKMLVYGVYLIETAQTIIIIHDAFKAYAVGFGSFAAVESAQLEWLTTPTFTGIVSCSVQVYYAYRLSILSGMKIIPIFITATALVQGIAGVIQGVEAHLASSFTNFGTNVFNNSIAVWLIGSAVCDIIVAISMTIVLVRIDSQIAQTQAVISRLIRLVVETGCLTAFSATSAIVLYFAFPHNTYFGTLGLILAKLYSNSLLVIFNSRLRIVDGRSDMTDSILILKQGRENGSPLRDIHTVNLGEREIRSEAKAWSDTDVGNSVHSIAMS